MKLSNIMDRFFSDSPIINNCLECGEKTWWDKQEKGYPSFRRAYCKICRDKLDRQEQEKEKEKYEKKKILIHENIFNIAIKYGMPIKFNNVRSSDFDKNQKELLLKIYNDLNFKEPDSLSYLLYGNTGVGKSHMAAYIFTSYIYRNWFLDFKKFVISWTSMNELLGEIKLSFEFDNKESESQILNKKCFLPKLLVFEFGDIDTEGNIYGGKQSAFTTQLFHKVIDYRWRHKKRTIFVTKLGKKQILSEQLLKHYDEASVGRLIQDCQLIFVAGQDKRLFSPEFQKSLWRI